MSSGNDQRLKTPFGNGQKQRVVASNCNVYSSNEPDSQIATQALFGESLTVYQFNESLAQVQLDRDRYVGWVDHRCLSATTLEPNVKVAARLAIAYSHPDLKSRPLVSLSYGALARLEEEKEDFGFCAESGWVFRQHYRKLDHYEHDPASVAETYINAPYQWGGRDSRGIDCSGLAQQAFEACNILLPRDTDMQFGFCSNQLEWNDNIDLERNDLIFWKGHVAIVRDKETIIHATAKYMCVVTEPIDSALSRIAESEGLPIGVHRYRIGE